MSAFDIPSGSRQLNGGAIKFDSRQLFPVTSAVSGRPGVNGSAVGQTTFQWREDYLYWLPSMSYFSIRAHILDGSGNALTRTSGIAYVDNPCSTLFSQIEMFVDSQSLESCTNIPQVDTACLYSSVNKSWLQSFGSASGVGESLMTRINNTAKKGSAAAGSTNGNELVFSWRPPISLFETAHGLPPGAQFRISFTWGSNVEQAFIESYKSAIAGTDFTVNIDSMTFYIATIQPDESVERPLSGYIELNPVAVNTYNLNAGTQLNANVPLQGTSNRMLVVCQDSSPLAGVGVNHTTDTAPAFVGTKSITYFSGCFSDGSNDLESYIQNFQLSVPEINLTFPQPQYSFSSGPSGTATDNGSCNKSDWERGYADWCNVTRGSSGGTEGSIEFGSSDTGPGAVILDVNIANPTQSIVQPSDPSNPQAAWVFAVDASTSSFAATDYKKTAAHGWLGNHLILAVPLVRPPGVMLSQANLTLVLNRAATAISVYTITSYSLGLEVTYDEYKGSYAYQIVRSL